MTLTPELIIKTVSDYFGQPVEMVVSGCQKKEYVKCRHLAMYFIKEKFFEGFSLQQVGTYFQGRGKSKDHATIMHAIKAVNDQKFSNKKYLCDYETLRRKLIGLQEKKAGHFQYIINFRFYYFQNRIFKIPQYVIEVKLNKPIKRPFEYSSFRSQVNTVKALSYSPNYV
jgi:ATPase involved in DNA replication initiation